MSSQPPPKASTGAPAQPAGNVKYQPVEAPPKRWQKVSAPGNPPLVNYDFSGVKNHRDVLVILNNWIEWLYAWAVQAEIRITELENRVSALEKQPTKNDPPGGKHPPPPPPFGG